MAVPKRKVSRSKGGSRRAHTALKAPTLMVDKVTGQWAMSHNIALDGYYNGKQVKGEGDK